MFVGVCVGGMAKVQERERKREGIFVRNGQWVCSLEEIAWIRIRYKIAKMKGSEWERSKRVKGRSKEETECVRVCVSVCENKCMYVEFVAFKNERECEWVFSCSVFEWVGVSVCVCVCVWVCACGCGCECSSERERKTMQKASVASAFKV